MGGYEGVRRRRLAGSRGRILRSSWERGYFVASLRRWDGGATVVTLFRNLVLRVPECHHSSMGRFTVHNIDEATMRELRARAEGHGHSAAEELHEIIKAALSDDVLEQPLSIAVPSVKGAGSPRAQKRKSG